ncbi:MAG TPA: thioredoxin domain-containing protein [Candidatus Limnocylindrales bacterium]|nr:thioredoxin domain-containing protein [Candidatus Limnocylindrales bacterium]
MTSRNTSDQPITRRERRAIERAERAGTKRPRPAPTPPWRSPMLLITLGALAVGLAIIAFAVLQRPPSEPITDELRAPIAAVPTGLAEGRTLGDANAPVTVEIWSDFQCPACRLFAQQTEPPIVDEFVVPGTARLVYHDAAFLGQRGDPSYDESVESAAAARVAADQGLFWQMHGWLFANWRGENEGAFRPERLREIAAAAGLDMADYDAQVATGGHQADVRSETAQAASDGITATPTIIVNGTAYTGALSYEQLAALIEEAAS